jgi:four helix bundle protein
VGHKFRDLKIWQNARVIIKNVYIATASFPSTEIYGLQSQARRAVVSIATNIAEGSGRSSNKDFNNFLNMAKGSLFEVQTLIIVSNDLNFIEADASNNLLSQCEELEKMIASFQRTLKIEKRR